MRRARALLGPNCMGVYCPKGRQTFVGGGVGPEGSVALISQSGGLAGRGDQGG
ncbi:hypothetical protein [Nonomuraea dietziae]|uniref:hypothetical protein n=1 Tax=Nonomuraea dietziae TaxID=65515 RepID=UPI0031DB325A